MQRPWADFRESTVITMPRKESCTSLMAHLDQEPIYFSGPAGFYFSIMPCIIAVGVVIIILGEEGVRHSPTICFIKER